MGQQIERAANLLERLYEQGVVSEEATNALLATKVAAAEIGSGLGKESPARELLLASLLVDDSPSIGSLVGQIHYGHDLILDALAEQQTTADIQVLTRAFNRGIIAPYEPLASATRLGHINFSESDQLPGSPLYLQSLLVLGTAVAKAQEIEDIGGRVRTFTLIITDGEDNSSGLVKASHVRTLVTDMLKFADNHIVAGMGIGDRCDFHAVFRAMGISDSWILTAKFRQIARSLALAASSETEFRRQLEAGPS